MTSTTIDFSPFFARPEFEQWHSVFKSALDERVDFKRHGDLAGWLDIVNSLPDLSSESQLLKQDTVTFGSKNSISLEQRQRLHEGLFALKPWRKGPYQIFDTFIDTEWRSDWKWQRVSPHLNSLNGRRVLDIGCGTGYHCWRMLGDGADYVLGIDPSMRFMVQHLAIQKYAKNLNFDFLPIGIEDMPSEMPLFDTVFSMGVLYHRRNPINHIVELSKLTKPGGEVVLETLIIDEIEGGILTPDDRYAQMRNVWSITTVDKTIELMRESGLKNARCVDQNVTSLDEQRSTEWMQFHSLKEFLDPQDISKTIEGYPAPKRGLFIADKA